MVSEPETNMCIMQVILLALWMVLPQYSLAVRLLEKFMA